PPLHGNLRQRHKPQVSAPANPTKSSSPLPLTFHPQKRLQFYLKRSKGYVEPTRGITGKVLIYLRGDLVCYCFLDHKGIVEETFIGGS
ncbi:MAG TPA: hypothetical protein VGH19_10515, partial [Verrucomicrobiae bacterium]